MTDGELATLIEMYDKVDVLKKTQIYVILHLEHKLQLKNVELASSLLEKLNEQIAREFAEMALPERLKLLLAFISTNQHNPELVNFYFEELFC